MLFSQRIKTSILPNSIVACSIIQLLIVVCMGIGIIYISTTSFAKASNNFSSFIIYAIVVAVFSIAITIMSFKVIQTSHLSFIILFIIAVIILILLLLFGLVYSQIGISKYENQYESICKNKKIISGFIYDVFISYPINSSLCKSNCPCLASSKIFPTQNYSSYSFDQNNGINYIYECKSDDFYSVPSSNMIKYLSEIEIKFSCSGCCDPPYQFYGYSGVSKGIPKDSCCLKIIDDSNHLLLYFTIISLIGVGINALTVSFTIIYICIKEKKNKYKDNQGIASSQESQTPKKKEQIMKNQIVPEA